MLKRAKTAHVVSEAGLSLPDYAFPIVFPYLDLKDHSRFARSCTYALAQSGLTEESPRRCVWAKPMTLDVKAGDESLERFNKFTNICKPTSLHMSLLHPLFDVHDAAMLAKLPLKRLSLYDGRCLPYKEIDLGFLRSLGQLQEFVLEGVVFSGAHLELLKGKRLTEFSLLGTKHGYNTDVTMISDLATYFPALRVLSIPNLFNVNIQPDVLHEQLSAFAAFAQLEVLDISYSRISSLAFVRDLQKLKKLSVDCCNELKDDAFVDLVHLPDLCEVSFAYNHDLTQESVMHLGRLFLTTVTFRLIPLCDEWVEKLLLSDAPRPVVRKVAMYDNWNVTSRALRCLSLLPSLVELVLSNCDFTDMSVLKLLHLESLSLTSLEKVDWTTLHGLVCGAAIVIENCTFKPRVTVELRRTGGGVVVHTEVYPPYSPYPDLRICSVMSPPLLR